MQLKIDPKIFEQHPNLKTGVIIIRGMNNSRRNSSIEALLRGICAQREKEFKNKEINDEEKIQVWNEAYAKFGVNPKKNPPSIAALLKRVKGGKALPHINPLVDLYNYFSLKYILPIGGEDLDWLCGDLQLTFTQGKEAFRPIGSIDVKEAKEGEVAYIDQGGITCRFWNHRECERTKFTNKTVNAALIIEDLTGMHMDQFGEILRDIQNSIIKYIGGQIEPYILTEDSPTLELGVEGRKSADDAKIPQQEKAHFEEIKKKTLKNKSKKQSITDKTLIISQLEAIFEKALKKVAPKTDKPIQLEYPSDQTHGDYACNIALQLSKELRTSPREIAEQIISKIPKNNLIESTDIAGPGFINIFLNQETLDKEVKTIINEGDDYGQCKVGKRGNVIFEYSSPNIAKPLGIHHILTTIIGQSLYDIYTKIGFPTISVNHIGDWGTQFGMVISAYKKWGNKEAIEKNPVDELLKLYIRFNEEVEKNPEIKDQARHEFKILEDGDEENRKLWQWFVDESMRELNQDYEKLGKMHFDHVLGESFYEDKMQPILEDGKNRKIFVEGEQGAYITEFEDPNIPPFVVQKKDGATLYSTRDFAALKYRIEQWKPEKVIYVVDIAQTLHFKQLFKAAERFPWYDDQGFHAWFGRMHLKDGKMSTRTGSIVRLREVLEEAVERSSKIIAEKSPHLENQEEVSKKVGIGAVKYNILSQNRTTDITFDWDRMLSFEGNSGPYLQYTYARAQSIIRRADEEMGDSIEDPKDADIKMRSLASFLPRFKEVLINSAIEYKPNILATYLYELSQRFNAFYNSVPVLKAKTKKAKKERLELVNAASQILKNGLALLGVEVVEEM